MPPESEKDAAAALVAMMDQLADVVYDTSEPLSIGKIVYKLSLSLALHLRQQKKKQQPFDIITDFFLLDVYDFIGKYLDLISGQLTVEQRKKLYRLKVRMSCTLHFNYQLDSIRMAERVEVSDDTQPTRGDNLPSIDSVCQQQVVFTDETRRVMYVENFSPSFALYTVAQLKRRVMPQVLVNELRNECDNEDGVAAIDTAAGGNTKKKKRRKKDCPNIAGAPPTVEQWHSICHGEEQYRVAHWPKPVVTLCSRDLMRDSMLQRFLANKDQQQQERDDNEESLEVPGNKNCCGALIRVFNERQIYKSDVDSFIYAQRKIYENDKDTSEQTPQQDFCRLMNRFCTAWAKMHYLEPTVFRKR
nr:MAG: hypothetical protein [Apis mellifra filamentous-like virus]